MRFLLFKGTRVTKKRHLSDIGERKMKTFVQTVALLIIAVLSVALYADELPSDHPSSAFDELPPVPVFDTTASDWNNCLESFDFRDYPNALKQVNSLIEKHPDNLTFLIRRARCLSAMGKADEALRIYDSLAQKFKDKDEQSAILSEKAVVLVQINKNKDALKLIQSVDNLNPSITLRYLNCKSIVLLINGKLEEANNILSNSFKQGECGQPEDYRNIGLLYAELLYLIKSYDVALLVVESLVDHYPSYGRFWLVRAAFNLEYNNATLLYYLSKAEQCRDSSAIRGGIYFLKATYYQRIKQDLTNALKYSKLSMDSTCQLSDFNKNAYLAIQYLVRHQYTQASLVINKLEKMAKTNKEQFEILHYKLYLAYSKKDLNEIQNILSNIDENRDQFSYIENSRTLINSYRAYLIANQQSEDSELSQLVIELFKDHVSIFKRVSPSIYFYTTDWNKQF